MSNDNTNKSTSGSNQNKLLLNIAKNAKSLNYIREYFYKVFAGKPDYKWEQFYCPCLIEFDDDEKWLLYTSTSYRPDRAKEWFWDSMFMKELTNAKYSFLIYAESTKETEKKEFLSWKQRILDKDGFYTIDNILSESELFQLIQEKGTEGKEKGLARHVRGNAFEERVANVLSDIDNLSLFLTDNHVFRGTYYSLFGLILKKFRFTKDSPISSIIATSDKTIIGRLPSGGYPKTDVIVEVYLTDGQKKTITISCKQTKENKVSVHQYKADAFADVLDKNNEALRTLLRSFQENAIMSAFGPERSKKLTEELKPYLRKLTLWVISGQYGEGEKHQIADYILINSATGCAIYSAEEYCELLLKNTEGGNFGTPFSWTFASKQRGKSIQLKCKIL